MDIDIPEILEDRPENEGRPFAVALPDSLDLTGKTVRDADGNPVGSVTGKTVRDRVVNLWRRRGIPCLQVAPGDF